MTRSLIWQALLASCLLRFVESASIQQDVEPPTCSDFVCSRHSLKTETRTFVEDVQSDDGKQIECKSCDHCTDTGYSFCLKPKNDEKHCLCAQELPRGCTVSPRTGFKPVPEQQQMNVCYLSSLRNPPKPTAVDELKDDIMLTIDQFWLKGYWKHMKLENLTLFYEFPINSPHVCDGLITTVNRQNSGEDAGYLCTPSLKIELEEEPIDSLENSDNVSQDYDNNLPPEIQFERAVFDGAPYVRFFYKIQVRRERQLNAHNAIVERLTMLTSDVLTYDLNRKNVKTTTAQTRVYKTTTTKILPTSTNRPSTSATTPAINKVNIEQRPQKPKESVKPNEKQDGQDKDSATHKSGSFLNEHLNNGGQLQLVVCVSAVTLGICLLLILGTFLYRRHVGNAKSTGAKIPATKQMNGFEYRATIQDER